jgi:hypothetical protein
VKVRVGVPAIAALALALALPAAAHFDPPDEPIKQTVGHYTVVLDSIRVLPHGNAGDPVALLIHTSTMGETHEPPVDALLAIRTRVGVTASIERPIYVHLDCTPSEGLDLVTDVASTTSVGRLGQPVAGLLKHPGIVTLEEEDRPHNRFPDAAGSQRRISEAIGDELARLPHFARYSLATPFALDPNSGTHTFRPRTAHPEYEFTATFAYTDVPAKPPDGVQGCNARSSLEYSWTVLELADRELRAVLYRTADVGEGTTRAERQACGAKTPPEYHAGRCGAAVRAPFEKVPAVAHGDPDGRTCVGAITDTRKDPWIPFRFTCPGHRVERLEIAASDGRIRELHDLRGFACRTVAGRRQLVCDGGSAGWSGGARATGSVRTSGSACRQQSLTFRFTFLREDSTFTLIMSC